jgi:hypothetical protein
MKILLLTLAHIISVVAYCQDEMDTDRPNESISTSVTGKKVFQLEAGWRKIETSEGDNIWRVPNVVLRYGLLKKIELRAESSRENQYLDADGITRKGMRPLELGLKASVFENKKKNFSTSLFAQAGLSQVASDDHKSDHAYHRIRLLFENKLSDKVKLNYNIGSEWDSEEQEQNWVYTFAPEFDLSDKWTLSTEVYGFVKTGNIPENVIDIAVAYFVTKNIRLDLNAGTGLNAHANNYFLDAGFSFRIK